MSKKGWALIEYGGEWEDSWENIIKIYTNKEKAEIQKEEKNKALAKDQDKIKKCWDCISITGFLEVEGIQELEALKKRMPRECDYFEVSDIEEEDGYYTILCKNDMTDNYRSDVYGYKLTEVEIEIG